MILGIDASNIKTGGGFTHLKCLLDAAEPSKYGITKIIVWGGDQILNLPKKDWLQTEIPEELKRKSFLSESIWKILKLPKIAKTQCDILFSPGGTFYHKKINYISMSQNMLIFDRVERKRAPLFSWNRIRLRILEELQKKSFKNASGIIFISNYAKTFIQEKINKDLSKMPVIPHGISDDFRKSPSKQKSHTHFNKSSPMKLLYVSIINYYKHQEKIAQAIVNLQNKGIPIQIEFVGPSSKKSLLKLEKIISTNDPNQTYLRYIGKIPFDQINKYYQKSDAFIFGSTCENMPNILIEAMSAGLPILSSDFMPMPEFLMDAAVYFNPLQIEDIEKKILSFFYDLNKRQEIANKAFNYSKIYSWEQCSDQTFDYISTTYKNLNHK